MNIPRIENWSLKGNNGGPYDPPETRRFKVSGRVFGNPKFDEGERITTSHIEAVSGIEVSTHSGSVYQLGRPSDEYLEWCREEGCHVPTPDEPIKSL